MKPQRYHPSELGPQEFAPLLHAWLETKSPRTRENYAAVLRRFADFVGVEDPIEAFRGLAEAGGPRAHAIVLQWRAAMQQAGLAQSTIGQRVSALRAMLRPLRAAGVITWTLEISGSRGRTVRDVSGPTLDETRRLLGAIEEMPDPRRARCRLAARLALDLGLRVFEIIALRWPEDCPGSDLLVRRKHQQSKSRWKQTDAVVRAIDLHLGQRGRHPGPLLGCTARTVQLDLLAAGRAAGIDRRVTPNGLRHTSNTLAVQLAQRAGIALPDVRQHSGHADVATLLLYQDRLRNVQGQISAMVAAELDDG